MTLIGRPIVAGDGRGAALVCDEPLSFWGGVDPETGEVIDRRHPWSGERVSGRILVLPYGRGSCSASGVLLEAVRNGTGPAGIVVSRVDPILGLGSILADELLGRPIPVILLADAERYRIKTGDRIAIHRNGRLDILEAEPS